MGPIAALEVSTYPIQFGLVATQPFTASATACSASGVPG